MPEGYQPLHAPGARMCLEAIWGYNIQTINCVGYDHNWVRGYDYDDDSAPLLLKDTISVAIMFIDLGNRVFLTDEQV